MVGFFLKSLAASSAVIPTDSKAFCLFKNTDMYHILTMNFYLRIESFRLRHEYTHMEYWDINIEEMNHIK